VAGACAARLRWIGAGAAFGAGTPAAALLLPGALVRGAVFPVVGAGVLGSVGWVAFKVGALSFGGGFVIIPLMQADAVGGIG